MTEARKPVLEESRVEGVLAFERASATPVARVRPGRRAPARQADVAAAELPELREGVPRDPRGLSLVELQSWFQTVITHPGSVEEGVRAAGVEAERVVRPGAQTTPLDGLEVYHHAYKARLVECLVDDYPALQHALGEEAFEDLARRYIVAHPSRSPNLNAYGRHMEAFCRGQDLAHAGFLADLARLEWALVEILHAEDAPPLSAAELEKTPPEQWAGAKLLPSHTFRLCRFDYPVNAYFQAFKEERAPSIPSAAPLALAVYRDGLTLWRMELTPAMADLLGDLARGETLGEALGRMEARIKDADELAEAAQSVMAWFSSWVRGGFFRAVTFA